MITYKNTLQFPMATDFCYILYSTLKNNVNLQQTQTMINYYNAVKSSKTSVMIN